jgi:hypothetical protein
MGAMDPSTSAANEARRRLQLRHHPTHYWATRRLPAEVRPATRASEHELRRGLAGRTRPSRRALMWYLAQVHPRPAQPPARVPATQCGGVAG